MKLKALLAAAGLVFAPATLWAQTSSTSASSANTNSNSAKIEDLQKSEEKKKDIDNEITDARMRATLGSKSKFSFKSTLGYSGGSLKEPGNSVRPAYRSGPDTETMATLSGTVGMNTRITDRDSITVGTGITIVDPLHGDITKNAEDKTSLGQNEQVSRYRIATPYLSWSRGYKAFDAQMISSATASYYTADTTIARGYLWNFGFSQTVLANLGTTKWTGGISFSLGKDFYRAEVTNKNFAAGMAAGTMSRDEWLLGAYPFMQYSFSDKYSFRTVFGLAEFQQKEKSSSFGQIEPYQSVGFGVSITRDIYLYPNVQFTPKDIRDDRTNVALSANINLF